MTTALVIATYNWTQALECCLKSFLLQSEKVDELIIADDGSDENTKILIEQFSLKHKIKLVHVWHEDNGFRLSHIRNKAIAKSSADYIIQIDGDIIMHQHFVRDHIRNSEPGRYIKGSRVLLNKDKTESILSHKNIDLNFYSDGIKNKINALHIPSLQNIFTKKISDPFKIRGCNMSFWRKDFISANGYNEDISGWGREDSELVMRFINASIFGKTLKFGAVAFHLFHNENSKSDLIGNNSILQETIDNKLVRCKNGIDKYL